MFGVKKQPNFHFVCEKKLYNFDMRSRNLIIKTRLFMKHLSEFLENAIFLEKNQS